MHLKMQKRRVGRERNPSHTGCQACSGTCKELIGEADGNCDTGSRAQEKLYGVITCLSAPKSRPKASQHELGQWQVRIAVVWTWSSFAFARLGRHDSVAPSRDSPATAVSMEACKIHP